MARFEKVSFDRYAEDVDSYTGDYNLFTRDEYDRVSLPRRATRYSAGYDFFAPHDIIIEPHGTVTFPTGIRVALDSDQFLAIYPRSGLGFQYLISLANTVGIIDADYYRSKNEGHIMVKLVNNSDHVVKIERGKAFAQGVIQRYECADGDNATGERDGGFGSTDRA